MQIQRSHADVARRLTLQSPNPDPVPPPQHHHGSGGALLHAGHDAAMIGMSLPAGSHDHGAMPICHGGAAAAPDPHAHHHQHSMPAEPSGTNWLSTGSAVLSGAVAVGAAVHGMQMLGSKDGFTRLEGANHLLMSASCGVMAAAMLAPQSGLPPFSAPLMAAHGLGEVALGAYQVSKGVREDCREHKLAGAIKIAHGGCLAAAQFFPAVALPLYLAMSAATATQILAR